MAVITTIFTPDSSALAGYRRSIELLADQILPAPIRHHRSVQVSRRRGYLMSTLGRSEHIGRKGFSCFSGLLDKAGTERWWTIGREAPDGSFCMVRSAQNDMEVISDFTGSRTIWHCRLACGGVAVSTAFEMLVGLLGNFQPDDKSLGWFLSSGTCGPRRSWDRRIKPLNPNASLHARRDGDAIICREAQLPAPTAEPGPVDEERLSAAISDAFEQLAIGDKPWLVALSGGYDSRAILYGLRDVKRVRCVTWADDRVPVQPGSDAYVAAQLAAVAGREHELLTIEAPQDTASLDQAIRRFVRYADGRIDNLLGYVDGMQIWDEISGWDSAGLMRGDELFGCNYAASESRILHNMRLVSFNEYADDAVQRSLAGEFNHCTPVGLQRRAGESDARWRLRLRADFEIPTVYAALNAVRSRFVENVCPLLMRSPVVVAAAMADRDSDDKALYKRVIGSSFAEVPFADSRSIASRPEFLDSELTRELLLDYLASGHARDTLGRNNAARVARRVERPPGDQDTAGSRLTMSRLGTAVPRWLKRAQQRIAPAPALNLRVLGLRSYLAATVSEEFTASAAIGRRGNNRVESVSA